MGVTLKTAFVLLFGILILGFLTGCSILPGYYTWELTSPAICYFCNCPRVVVTGDYCCIDKNLNGICDSQENNTRVVVEAKGEGNVVIVSGLNVVETDDTDGTQTTIAPSAIPTTSTTSTTTTTTTIADLNQSINESTDDGGENATEDCNNVDLMIFRARYNDGEDSNVEILMRNNGAFDIKKWRVKVYDEENGLALQQRFYKRLNASMVDELKFEFGDNDLVNADNDVVKVKIAPIVKEEICEEYTIIGDKLET